MAAMSMMVPGVGSLGPWRPINSAGHRQMSWLGAHSKELERAAVKLAILAAMLAPRALAAESPKTRTASHRLQVKLTKGETGRLVTQFAEPYSPATGQYDVQIRCAFGASGRGRLQLLVDGAAQGAAWEAKAVAGLGHAHRQGRKHPRGQPDCDRRRRPRHAHRLRSTRTVSRDVLPQARQSGTAGRR